MTSNGISDKPSRNRKAKWGIILGILSVVLGLLTYVTNDRKLADLKDRMATLNDAKATLEAFNADDTQKVESFMNAPDGTSGADRVERLNRFIMSTGDSEILAVKSFLERVPDEMHSMSFSSLNQQYEDARHNVLMNRPTENGDVSSFNATTDASDRLDKAHVEVRDYIGMLLKDANEESERGERSYEIWKKVSLLIVLTGAGIAAITIFMGRKAAAGGEG